MPRVKCRGPRHRYLQAMPFPKALGIECPSAYVNLCRGGPSAKLPPRHSLQEHPAGEGINGEVTELPAVPRGTLGKDLCRGAQPFHFFFFLLLFIIYCYIL